MKAEETREMLTVTEMAILFRVTPRTIGNWMRQGRLPYLKIGNVVRFKFSTIKELMSAREVAVCRSAPTAHKETGPNRGEFLIRAADKC